MVEPDFASKAGHNTKGVKEAVELFHARCNKAFLKLQGYVGWVGGCVVRVAVSISSISPTLPTHHSNVKKWAATNQDKPNNEKKHMLEIHVYHKIQDKIPKLKASWLQKQLGMEMNKKESYRVGGTAVFTHPPTQHNHSSNQPTHPCNPQVF